jgi:hypothetical protein
MMTKLEIVNPIAAEGSRFGPTPPELSPEDQSKDEFFVRLAALTEEMIAKHGKDFAMGTLILSARFVAENKPLIKQADGTQKADGATAHRHDSSCRHT